MSITIPCLIKQPHRQQLAGWIVGDRGADFDVKVNDKVQTVSKLYVFPNFPPPKKCRIDQEITPSKNTPKSRRKRGTGNGYIYWRTVKKVTVHSPPKERSLATLLIFPGFIDFDREIFQQSNGCQLSDGVDHLVWS